jgi:hypothetical protein
MALTPAPLTDLGLRLDSMQQTTRLRTSRCDQHGRPVDRLVYQDALVSATANLGPFSETTARVKTDRDVSEKWWQMMWGVYLKREWSILGGELQHPGLTENNSPGLGH